MEAHIHEWTNLLIRWIHFIAGTAWIGASFYFNWLENNLDRRPAQESDIAGNLWAVHGGGFYHLKKFAVTPAKLPTRLHWFKWEAYTTWLSGVSLLVVVYYLNARLYLLDPAISNLSISAAISVGAFSILASWLIYDLLCKSWLQQYPVWLGGFIFGYLALLSWMLCQLLSGRGAYIHVGAAIGTIMVANVFFVIIPAQKEMVNALAEHRRPDPAVGKNGLLRSRHNNYLTLPVLFTMISGHFPSTYTSNLNWFILVALFLVGIVVRHYFNVRHIAHKMIWLLPLGFAAMLMLMWVSAPKPPDDTQAGISVTDAQAMAIINNRCSACHSATPSQAGVASAPQGIVFDDINQAKFLIERIYQTTVASRTMPIANLTSITEQERRIIAGWYLQNQRHR